MRKLHTLILAVGLLISTAAAALSALEFVKLESGSDQRKAVEPIIYGFVSAGYKKVPDWAELTIKIRKKVLEKGYSYQSLEQVAKEAAEDAGMTR